MKSTLKKRLGLKALAITLAVILLLPTVSMVNAIQEPTPEQFGIVIPVDQGLARGTMGVTPEQLNAMAIDPQSWRLPEHQTWEDYTRHPIVDWDGYRSDRPDVSDAIDFRGALIIVEFPDRPLMTRGPAGAGLMGNPQRVVNVFVCPLEKLGCNVETGVGCDMCVAQLWDDFFNRPYTELNNSITIGGYWLENSLGQWNITLDIYGPFMMPMFEFQFAPTGSFWNRDPRPSGGIFGGRYDFGDNFHFGNQFPQWGWGTGNLMDVNFASAIPVPGAGTTLASNATFTPTVVRAAMEQDPYFVDNFVDEDGNVMYEFIFITGAGYAQTATWQEMGSMMFDVRPEGVIDWGQIAETTDIVHPITREVMPGMTGMDFTGYARVRNLYNQVTAPGFDIAEAWPNFFMLDYEAMWRAEVTTNPPNLLGNRTLTAGFTAARSAYETANLVSAFNAFRIEFPDTNLTQAQFQTTVFRPQFIASYANLRKLALADDVMQVEIAGFADMQFEYEYVVVAELFLEDGGTVYEKSVTYIIPDEVLEIFGETWNEDSPFVLLEEDAPVYSEQWLAFYANWSDSQWVQGELIRRLEEAMYDARTNAVNPYFGAVPSRYVPWSSWYGTAGTWSHANTGFNVVGLDAIVRGMPVSAQSESTGMSTYSHELGHLVGLPDNDNSPYAAIPRRSLQGAWDIMARGTFVGPGGGHTRWMIPATYGASVGAHQNIRGKIANGFTDLTIEGRDNVSGIQGVVTSPTGRLVNWVRPDPQYSRDILYVPYTQFRAGPPVVGEVFGRNVPVNQGFLDYHGAEIEGFIGIVIQGAEFDNRTPAVASNWAANLLPGGATLWDGRSLDPNGYDPRTGFRRIDPVRWNYMRTDGPGSLGIGLTNIGPETSITVGGETRIFGTPDGIPLTGRQHGFSVEVVDRTGYDSFMHDHGVFINRITHTNAPRAGGMENPASFIIDANPGPFDIVQFIEADGSYYMKADCHYVNMAAATFHAGLHNDPRFLREQFPEKFRADDPRPGVAGHTVNEWVDTHNEFHFYILQRHNNSGRFGTFLSYDVAVRNTAPDAYVVGGGLELVTVGTPSIASPGNFSVQTMALTHTGDATATDIVRVVLQGALGLPVMNTTDGGFEYKAHTMDQNVVILNNLFAISPGETIEFDVFIRVPTDHTGITFDTTGRLDVRASSETNSDKYAYVNGAEVNLPFALSFNIFNNGNNNNASLANMGIIRMWPQINGAGSNLSHANLTVTAYDQDGAPAMGFVNVNRIWNNQDYVSLIDVNKHAPWQHIDMVVEYRGQVFEVQLINNMFLSFRAFNNGTCDEVPSMAGNIRIWPQLGGVGAPIPMSAVLTAVDQDGNNALGLITRNRQWIDGSGWQDNYVNFDVDKNAQWQTILFTVTIFGQSVEVLLINNLFVAEQLPVLGLNAFNNGNSSNASLANAGIIRIWTQLDGVNALIPYAGLIVTAYDQDENPAMQFVRVNRVWNNTGYVNLIDVTKRDANWETMDLTLTLGTGQTVELLLTNDLFGQ
ncbi:MAG: hypothetical protein FWC75_03615 [Oscillospiraceae bacterium]|nr:hypothetical protein [Oscillospiraceae bacterium]